MVIIYKNNLLNNYNKETELTPSSTHFSNNNYNDTNNDKDDNHKKYENIIKVFSIDFSKIDIKKDMIVYSTLLFFILMSIFFGILNKKMDVIISSILISYITLYLLSKIFLLQNTRYTNIAVWNLYSSLSMLFKSINNDNSDDNQLKIDYYKIIQYSIILYFSSLVIGFIPTISFLNVLSIISLLISYILAFSNKDLDVIKDSLKIIKNFSPCALVLSFMLGVSFYNSYALNFAGYITWLILYFIYFVLKDFVFEEM